MPSGEPTCIPSSSPSGEPTCVPSGEPTCIPSGEPSATPTSIPTTSEPTASPTTVFFGTNIFDNLDAFELEELTGDITFRFGANDAAQYDQSTAEWLDLYDTFFVDQAIDLQYPRVSVWSFAISDGQTSVFNVSYTCQTPVISNGIINALEGGLPFAAFFCDGVEWVVRGTRLCVNCTDTNFASACSLPDEHSFLLTPDSSCDGIDLVKYAGVIQIASEEVIPDSVPLFNITNIVASNFSADVVLNVTTSGYGGSTYCAAVLNTTELTSVATIILENFIASSPSELIISPGRETQSITVNGLSAETAYAMYCYTEDSYGNGLDLETVVSSRVSFTTGCCRSIVFSNVPESVTGNVTQYSNAEADTYTIRYVLSSLFETNAIVTPIVLDESGSILSRSNERRLSTTSWAAGFQRSFIRKTAELDVYVDVLPSSITFSSGDTNLEGAFIISASVGLSSNITIVMNVTTDDGSTYLTPSTNMQVVNLADNPAPPSILRASFSSTGASVSVLFDSSFDTIRFQEENDIVGVNLWDCSLLFTFSVSSDASCSIVSSSVVRVSLVARSVVQPGTTLLTLVDDVIYAACLPTTRPCITYAPSPAQTVTIAYPARPITPAPRVIAPRSVGRCDALVINPVLSTGHGGRAWSVIEWIVTASDPNADVSEMMDILSTTSKADNLRSTVVISRDVLDRAAGNIGKNSSSGSIVYTFSLGLRNFLQSPKTAFTRYAATDVVRDVSLVAPLVTVVGQGYRTAYRYDSLLISSTATQAVCGNDSSTINFAWRVYENNLPRMDIVTQSANPRVMLLDPFTLKTNVDYVFQVRAFGDSGGVSAASVSVHVLAGDVFAIIAGGSSRTVSPYSALELDGSDSFDEDSDGSVADDLSYRWLCVYQTPSRFGESCNSEFEDRSSVTLAVPRVLLVPRVAILVTLTVRSRDGRSDSTTSRINVGQSSSNVSLSIDSSFVIFNINERLTLDATAVTDADITATWSLTSVDSIDLTSDGILLTSIDRQLTPPPNSLTTFVFPLAVNADVFSPGLFYTFTLRASEFAGIALVSSSVTLFSNAAPTSGQLIVTPEVGVAYEDTFTFAASSWVDDEDGYPLRYAFRYSLRESELATVYTIRAYSESPFASTMLPEGMADLNETVFCSVRVSDIFDASVASFTPVIATLPFDIDRVNISMSLLGDIAFHMASADVDAVLQTSAVAAQVLVNAVNCSMAPFNCSLSFNREPCSSVPHTCGTCLDGFEGVIGSSNSECYVMDTTANSVFASRDGSIHRILVAGESCVDDSSCLLGFCNETIGECQTFSKVCMSDNVETDCSGNGYCTYVNGNQETVDMNTCRVDNDFCSAVCACDKGFGGSYCQYTFEELQMRDLARTQLCESLLDVNALQDASSESLEALIGLLVLSFEPSEMLFNSTGFKVCSSVMLLMMELVEDGYLDSLGTSYRELTATGISTFAMSLNMSNVNDDVTSAVNSLVSGLQADMVAGQSNVDISTDAFRMSMFFSLASQVADSELMPVASASEMLSNTPVPRIVLSNDGLGVCGGSADGDFSQFTMTQWSKANAPYRNISSLETNILRFASPLSGSTSPRKNISFRVVTYFNEPMDFNNTAPGCIRVSVDVNNETADNTLDRCNCNVENYTAFNVTFQCFDLESALCPPASVGDDDSLGSSQNLTFFSHRRASKRQRKRYHTEYGRRLGASNLTVFPEPGLAMYGSALVDAFNDIGATISGINLQNFKENLEVFYTLVALIIAVFIGYLQMVAWDLRDFNRHKYVRNAERLKVTTAARAAPQILKFGKGVNKAFSFLKNTIAFKGKEEEEVDNDSLYGQVKSFFDGVLESTGVLEQKKSIVRFQAAILREHLWFRPFTYSSSQTSRSIRYLNWVTELLILVFVDSLFFGIVYPADTCTQYSFIGKDQRDACLMQESPVTSDGRLCEWNEATYECSINSPPETLLFFVGYSIVITLFAVPIKILSNFFLDEFCAKRPNFEETVMPEWFVSIFVNSQDVERGSHVGFVRQSALGDLFQHKDEVDSNNSQKDSIARTVGLNRYYDFLPIGDELDYIIRSVYTTLNKEIQLVQFPWRSAIGGEESIDVTSIVKQDRRREAILNFIGLYPDCTPIPLNWYNWLRFGTHDSYLRNKLASVRVATEGIIEETELLAEFEEDMKDSLLVQHFILEQLPFLKRIALESHLLQFDMAYPQQIAWYVWLLAWTFQVCLMGFFFFWILAWAIANGQGVFISWGFSLVLVLLEDFFIAEPMICYLVHVMAIEVMQPQLRHIYHTLQKIAVDKLSDDYVPHGDIRISQHFSATCRAARDEQLVNLPSSKLLTRIDDDEVDQCRGVRRAKVSLLSFVAIGLPTLFGFFGNNVQDFVFDVLVAMIWGCFLLFNDLLIKISIYLLIAVYACLVMLIVYFRVVIIPQRRDRRRRQSAAKYTGKRNQFQHRTWIQSLRHKKISTNNPIGKAVVLLTKYISSLYSSDFHVRTQEEIDRRLWRNMNMQLAYAGASETQRVARVNYLKRKSQSFADQPGSTTLNRSFLTLDSDMESASRASISDAKRRAPMLGQESTVHLSQVSNVTPERYSEEIDDNAPRRSQLRRSAVNAKRITGFGKAHKKLAINNPEDSTIPAEITQLLFKEKKREKKAESGVVGRALNRAANYRGKLPKLDWTEVFFDVHAGDDEMVDIDGVSLNLKFGFDQHSKNTIDTSSTSMSSGAKKKKCKDGDLALQANIDGKEKKRKEKRGKSQNNLLNVLEDFYDNDVDDEEEEEKGDDSSQDLDALPSRVMAALNHHTSSYQASTSSKKSIVSDRLTRNHQPTTASSSSMQWTVSRKALENPESVLSLCKQRFESLDTTGAGLLESEAIDVLIWALETFSFEALTDAIIDANVGSLSEAMLVYGLREGGVRRIGLAYFLWHIANNVNEIDVTTSASASTCGNSERLSLDGLNRINVMGLDDASASLESGSMRDDAEDNEEMKSKTGGQMSSDVDDDNGAIVSAITGGDRIIDI